MSWVIKNGPICNYFHFCPPQNHFHLENIQQSVLCFLNGRCRKCVLGHGKHLVWKIVEKADICFLFYLLFILVHYISSAPLVGLFFISEPTRPCSAHRCMKSDMYNVHVYLHVYSRGGRLFLRCLITCPYDMPLNLLFYSQARYTCVHRNIHLLRDLALVVILYTLRYHRTYLHIFEDKRTTKIAYLLL